MLDSNFWIKFDTTSEYNKAYAFYNFITQPGYSLQFIVGLAIHQSQNLAPHHETVQDVDG